MKFLLLLIGMMTINSLHAQGIEKLPEGQVRVTIYDTIYNSKNSYLLKSRGSAIKVIEKPAPDTIPAFIIGVKNDSLVCIKGYETVEYEWSMGGILTSYAGTTEWSEYRISESKWVKGWSLSEPKRDYYSSRFLNDKRQKLDSNLIILKTIKR